MKPSDRQLELMEILRNEGCVTVTGLVDSLKVSAETVRRDLTALAAIGKLQKVHGGAVLPRGGEGAFQDRLEENVSAKRKIAKKAADLVSAGDTLLVDTGSTTLLFAEELSAINNLTVITNSVDIAKVVSTNKTTTVFLLGGEYRSDCRENLGPLVLEQIRHFQVNKVILTVAAIEATAGVMDFDLNEAQVARTMIKQAKELIVLVDNTKFNEMAPFSVASFDQIHAVVSNKQPTGELAVALAKDGVLTI